MAILFAREGADVTIVYLPEEQEDAEATKKAIEGEKQACLLIPGDLMDNKTCEKAVGQHVDKYATTSHCRIPGMLENFERGANGCRYGRVDVLVNNASKQIMAQDFADIDLDNVESTFRSNILQMFAMTKFCVPHMPKGSAYVFDLLEYGHTRRC